MTTSWDQQERRKFLRIRKNFILSYYNKSHPETRHDATQLKNISIGGMCFLTSLQFRAGTIIAIELKTPYLTGTVYLEGKVVGCVERLAGTVYETRLAFDNLSQQAEFVLQKIVEYYKDKTK